MIKIHDKYINYIKFIINTSIYSLFILYYYYFIVHFNIIILNIFRLLKKYKSLN